MPMMDPVVNNVGMRVRRAGQHGLLVECADPAEVADTYAELRRRAGELGVVDIVPAARSVLLDGLVDAAAVAELIADWSATPGAAGLGHAGVIEIPVTYDGPDLAEVARQWDVSTDEVIHRHRATEFVVAFCGFAPGFAYCTGLPAELSVRRRAEPRAKVLPGSVALAGEFTSVYPSASPGGWQLIGTTTTPVWRPEDERPALLEPGTRVRFVDA
jgi:KipI family sensor histidine kinase inhibitor